MTDVGNEDLRQLGPSREHLALRHRLGRRQFTSLRYGERLAEIGAVPSIGTVGDCYDNALAETVNGYYKAELIRGPARSAPWKPSKTSSSRPWAG